MIDVVEVGTATQSAFYASGSPVSVGVTLTTAAPAPGALVIALHSVSTSGFIPNWDAATVTDTAGNTYTRFPSTTGALGTRRFISIWYAETASALAVSDSITVTTANVSFDQTVTTIVRAFHLPETSTVLDTDLQILGGVNFASVQSYITPPNVIVNRGTAALFVHFWGYNNNSSSESMTDDTVSHTQTALGTDIHIASTPEPDLWIGEAAAKAVSTSVGSVDDAATVDSHSTHTVIGYLVGIAISFRGLPKGDPWNLETLGGQYHIAYRDAGSIKYRRSDSTYPPLGTATTVSGGGSDEAPRIWEEPQPAGRIRLLWRRSNAVLTAHSNDDGDTWSTPVTLWSSGSSPGWATGNSDRMTGITLFAANVGGALQIRRQGPGDSTAGSAFTATGLPTLDDTSFHLWPAEDAQRRWLLVFRSGGDILNYVSTDDGESFYAA